MRQKIYALLIITLFSISAFNVLALKTNIENNSIEKLNSQKKLTFSKIEIKTVNDFTEVELKEATTFTKDSGRPIIPVIVKTYNFPKYTKIKEVKCYFSDFTDQKIDHKIKPAPKPIPLIKLKEATDINRDIKLDMTIYQSSDFYPEKKYDYDIICGIDGLKVIIRLYPIRYKPTANLIKSFKNADIEVIYEKSSFFPSFEEEYDMVIISPEEFTDALQPLIDHKKDVGIDTFIKTTEEIYNEFEGRDKPEKIKYFIKYAIDNYNISYVLLAGGRINQRLKWHVPVRYAYIPDYYEYRFISDLYYADIYRYNESSESLEFESWDSNNNDRFAEFGEDEDFIDCYPDVYIGRIACRNTEEVKDIVQKIIYYETNTYDSEWFKKMILVGGDTFPVKNLSDADSKFYEGEISTEYGSLPMRNLSFDIVKLWASNGNLTNSFNVSNALEEGAGFIYFDGHGNPSEYATHPPSSNSWIIGLFSNQMKSLNNAGKYPICIIGGCHNSQFDVARMNFIKGLLTEGPIKYFMGLFDNYKINRTQGGFWKGEWVSHCWSWEFTRQENAGAIATIGNTGIGYGYVDDNATDGLSSWLTSQFFYAYSKLVKEQNDSLGKVYTRSITDYLDTFRDMNNPKTDDFYDSDQKTLLGYTLLGDPSLKIGGYLPS